MAGLAIASAPIICSTTVPGMSRSMRKTSTVSAHQGQGHRVQPDDQITGHAPFYALSSQTPSKP